MTIQYGFPAQPAALSEVCAQVPLGWRPLLSTLLANLAGEGWDGELLQVKEKLGGLRVYIGAGSDAVFDLICAAEGESLRTCQACGGPGRGWERGGRWRTLCEGCAEKRNEEESVG